MLIDSDIAPDTVTTYALKVLKFSGSQKEGKGVTVKYQWCRCSEEYASGDTGLESVGAFAIYYRRWTLRNRCHGVTA